MREMRIWPLDAAKYYKNAGKFFPDAILKIYISSLLIVVKTDILDFALSVYLV